MKLVRRQLLPLAAAAAALPALARRARAQAWPARPVRIVIGFTAGGAFDIVGRLMAQWLSDRLGQQFIVENRPGASSNIAAEAVVLAPPDGHTLLLGGATNAINTTLYPKLNFDFGRDLVPIVGLIRLINVVEVNPSFPARTVPELIAYAKANPGKINMASAGNGTSQHLAGELFKMMTGIDMVHVPYKGSSQSVADLVAGQVQMSIDPLPASIGQIRAGKLRALAVTTAQRAEALPDVPTVAEFVPGYEASGWNGMLAPRNTPGEIVATLNKEINAGLADAKIKARLADLGAITLGGSPADFGKLIAEETEKWSKVVRATNVKPE
jgi:tripartite-type tricarboxylate transporter receptor subunit TctC